MGIFALRPRSVPGTPDVGGELSTELRLSLPPRFEAVAEALHAGSDPTPACRVVGHDLARDGASLQEALEGLRETTHAVTGRDPAYDDIAALLGAWSDATLAYLHQVSCEEPMTGLASVSHLRSRLGELFRAQRRHQGSGHLGDHYCLVVVDLPFDRHGPAGSAADQSIVRSLRMARVGEAVRTVFVGSETIGRVGADRVVVIAERDPQLGKRVGLVRRLVEGLAPGGRSSHVWIEGLPASDAAAAALLDELARP